MSNSIFITEYEHKELLDHLFSRPDIWKQNPDNEHLWLRLVGPDAVCAIHFEEGTNRSCTVYPISWDEKTCEEYLVELCTCWTDWGRRQKLTTFIASARLENLPSDIIAMKVLEFDHDGQTDPEPPSEVLEGSMLPEAWIRLYMSKIAGANELDPRLDTLAGLIEAWKKGRYAWESILP